MRRQQTALTLIAHLSILDLLMQQIDQWRLCKSIEQTRKQTKVDSRRQEKTKGKLGDRVRKLKQFMAYHKYAFTESEHYIVSRQHPVLRVQCLCARTKNGTRV